MSNFNQGGPPGGGPPNPYAQTQLGGPPGYAPPPQPQQQQQGYAPPPPQPQGYAPQPQGYAPPQPPQGYAPQAPQGYAPQQPQGYAPQQPGYAPPPGYPQQQPGYPPPGAAPGYPPQPGYGAPGMGWGAQAPDLSGGALPTNPWIPGAIVSFFFPGLGLLFLPRPEMKSMAVKIFVGYLIAMWGLPIMLSVIASVTGVYALGYLGYPFRLLGLVFHVGSMLYTHDMAVKLNPALGQPLAFKK